MGTNKLLLPFAGSSVIARVVDAHLGAPAASVIVVVRPRDSRLCEALGGRRVVFVENPDAGGDMLSSLRCGLRGLLQHHAAAVIEWPTADAAVREDLDTPADYELARASQFAPYV